MNAKVVVTFKDFDDFPVGFRILDQAEWEKYVSSLKPRMFPYEYQPDESSYIFDDIQSYLKQIEVKPLSDEALPHVIYHCGVQCGLFPWVEHPVSNIDPEIWFGDDLDTIEDIWDGEVDDIDDDIYDGCECDNCKEKANA